MYDCLFVFQKFLLRNKPMKYIFSSLCRARNWFLQNWLLSCFPLFPIFRSGMLSITQHFKHCSVLLSILSIAQHFLRDLLMPATPIFQTYF